MDEADLRLFVEHAVALQRHCAHVADNVRKRLRKLDRALAAELESRRDNTPIQRQQMRRALNTLSTEAHSEIRAMLTDSYQELLEREVAHQTGVLSTRMGARAIEPKVKWSDITHATIPTKPSMSAGKFLGKWLAFSRKAVTRALATKDKNDVATELRKRNAYTLGIRKLTMHHLRTTCSTMGVLISNIVKSKLAQANAIASYLYVAVIDNVTTIICLDLDGDVYAVGQGPLPPQHPGCRSSTLLLLPGDSGNPFRYVRGGRGVQRIRASTSGERFLRTQTIKYIASLAGMSEPKARLFRQGKLPLDVFWDAVNRAPADLSDIIKKYPRVAKRVLNKKR